MRTLFLAMIALTFLAGCGETSEPGAVTEARAPAPTVEHVAATYTQLTAMTQAPVLVDAGLAEMCRGVTPRDVELAQQRLGPHLGTAVNIYMNEPAAAAFKQRIRAYPVGSVIVKEKKALVPMDGQSGSASTPHGGVGGMIKRPAGYDSEHGDWEYFYFEDASKIESGKISSCIECHAGAGQQDHVFGHWSSARQVPIADGADHGNR